MIVLLSVIFAFYFHLIGKTNGIIRTFLFLLGVSVITGLILFLPKLIFVSYNLLYSQIVLVILVLWVVNSHWKSSIDTVRLKLIEVSFLLFFGSILLYSFEFFQRRSEILKKNELSIQNVSSNTNPTISNYGYDVSRLASKYFDENGYNEDGFDENGYNEAGFDENGYNEDGYDENGYNEDGFDENGYNEDGFDENWL